MTACNICSAALTKRNRTGRCRQCSYDQRRTVFSREADAILRRDYPAHGAEFVADQLPGVSLKAVRYRAKNLGIKREPRAPIVRPPRVRKPKDATAHMQKAARSTQAMVRRSVVRAMTLIEQGVAPGQVKHGQARMAMTAAQEIISEQRRRADPIEQAKTILRRRFRPVVEEVVYGGQPGRFRVGMMKDVTAQDLLAMAANEKRVA